MQFTITSLTPQQESSIPTYREKWREIERSTEPINPDRVQDAVKDTYEVLGKKAPKILFFDSPRPAIQIANSVQQQEKWFRRSNLLGITIMERFTYWFDEDLGNEIFDKFYPPFDTLSELDKLDGYLHKAIWNYIHSLNLESLPAYQWLQPGARSPIFGLLDFCISVLKCPHDRRQWQAFKKLIQSCGCTFFFEKTCLVCARPIKICIDDISSEREKQKPIIEFVDGFSVYKKD